VRHLKFEKLRRRIGNIYSRFLRASISVARVAPMGSSMSATWFLDIEGPSKDVK